MASDIWLRTILIVRKETRCRHIGYSFRLTARVLLYAPSHRQDSTYHGLCYTSRGALAVTRNSSMGSPHEGSIRRPIASWANALTTELHLALLAWILCTKLSILSSKSLYNLTRITEMVRMDTLTLWYQKIVISGETVSERGGGGHSVNSYIKLNFETFDPTYLFIGLVTFNLYTD